MSTVRRVLAGAVAVLLLMGQIAIPTVRGDWSNTVVAAIPDVDRAECGETVTVTFRFDQNPDGDTYIDWRVKLAYDTSTLAYRSFTVNPAVWASGSGAGGQQRGGDDDGWVRIGEGNFTGESVDFPIDLGTVTFEVIGEGSSGFAIVTADPYADTGFTDPDRWPAYAPGSTSVAQIDLFCNEPPVADAGGPYTGDRTETVTLDGSGSHDPDGHITTYEWRVEGTRVYSGTSETYDLALSAYVPGTYDVLLIVTDDDGATDQDATVLEVFNVPPVAQDVAAVTDEGVPVAIDVTANDYDLDGEIDLGTVSVVQGPQSGSAQVDPTTGVVTYTPTVDFHGVDAFTYTVDDDDGATSNEATVSVTVIAAPVISHLDPISTPVGSLALTLTVYGNHFIPASAVHWDGEARSTTFISATQLAAAIPASDLTAIGTAGITVVNPRNQGGTSNVVFFTIAPLDPDPDTYFVYLPLVRGSGPAWGGVIDSLRCRAPSAGAMLGWCPARWGSGGRPDER